jgi:DNA-nicking Smr family endonuclease
MPHQDELDLHGYTVEEAKRETEAFLRRSRKSGYRKVLIIHGKGTHTDSDGRLRREIRQFLQKHGLAGRLLEPDQRNGGRGAVWVILRR